MFDRAVEGFLSEAGISSEEFRFIHLSAHSGGGETMTRLLDRHFQSRFLSPSAKVTIYDGIYSAEAKNRILSWLQDSMGENQVELNLFSMPGQTPSKFGKILLDSLSPQPETEVLAMDGYSLVRTKKIFQNGSKVTLVQEAVPSRLNHWSLVDFFWLY